MALLRTILGLTNISLSRAFGPPQDADLLRQPQVVLFWVDHGMSLSTPGPNGCWPNTASAELWISKNSLRYSTSVWLLGDVQIRAARFPPFMAMGSFALGGWRGALNAANSEGRGVITHVESATCSCLITGYQECEPYPNTTLGTRARRDFGGDRTMRFSTYRMTAAAWPPWSVGSSMANDCMRPARYDFTISSTSANVYPLDIPSFTPPGCSTLKIHLVACCYELICTLALFANYTHILSY